MSYNGDQQESPDAGMITDSEPDRSKRGSSEELSVGSEKSGLLLGSGTGGASVAAGSTETTAPQIPGEIDTRSTTPGSSSSRHAQAQFSGSPTR